MEPSAGPQKNKVAKAQKIVESKDIQRLRKRLSRRLEEQDKQLTPEALQQVSSLLKRLSERRASSTIDLKQKRVSLFKKTAHPSKESKATLKLRELIKRDYFPQ